MVKFVTISPALHNRYVRFLRDKWNNKESNPNGNKVRAYRIYTEPQK